MALFSLLTLSGVQCQEAAPAGGSPQPRFLSFFFIAQPPHRASSAPSTAGCRGRAPPADLAALPGQPEAAWAGGLARCSEATGKSGLWWRVLQMSMLPHSPPLTLHPHPTAFRVSEIPRGPPTYSVPCGVGVSDQATTGVSAGDSTFSSSASSSWEGSLFLQGHRRARGLQRGQGPRGTWPTLILADHSEPSSEEGTGQRMALPIGHHSPAGRQQREAATLGTSVSTSVQWPSIKVTALTWSQANLSLHPALTGV